MSASSEASARREREPIAASAGQGSAVVDATLASQKDNIAQLTEISRNSQTTFLALIAACVYSYLTIATTTDAALLSNSNATPLPIIQVNVPIVWFYYFAPVILTVLFVYFHLYLERFWRGIARLPLRHPDGRGLDDYVYPWLISCAVIRGEIRELSASHRVSARLEAWLSLLLGWGLVPIVLLFYWGRYATAHDRWGTLVHVALVLLSVGFALHYLLTARNALHHMSSNSQAGAEGGNPSPSLDMTRRQKGVLAAVLFLLGVVLLYLSGAAVRSLSDSDCEGVGARTGCAFYATGRAVWQAIGVDPYSVVREGRFVAKPANWQQLVAEPVALRNYLEGQRGLVLVGRDLRNMNASEAFMPGSRFNAANLDFADLSHAVMTGSRFDSVTLHGAKLTDAALQHMEITDSQFDEVSAMASHFDHATFKASDSTRRTRLSGNFSSATFDHAEGDWLQVNTGDGVQNQTSLRGASLRGVSFRYSDFNRVDLSMAPIEDATLAHSRFVDTDFSGASIRRSFMNFSVFTRCRFIATDIEDSLFEEAKFEDSEFDTVKTTTPGAEAGRNPPPPRKRIARFQAVLASFDDKTRIRNLHFADAELRSARFNGLTLANTLFSNSDLSGAVFDKVDLSGVEFQDVDLSGADLSTARNIPPRLLDGACGNKDTRLPPGHTVKPCPPRRRLP
ncbi:pentapeptide repeat-containing protein [Piscinibacter sp.]|uniref:pentapeptide repeat-containing protein n=1 Tax=Piscinibacter sp. TaxID=1903157 RepID=UPI003559A0E3